MIENRELVSLGKDLSIEESAIIGYMPAREIPDMKLNIGDQAHIRSNSVIYLGSKIGNGFECGHNAVIREENLIGDDVCIWSGTVIDYGCRIGKKVKIHCNVYIGQFSVIEEEVFVAPGVAFANDPHPGCDFSKQCLKGPHIEKGVKIGANSVVLPYVRIGQGSLIGSGSVVTKEIPKESVAYGNPAEVVGSIYDLKCTKGFTDKPYRKRG